MLQPYAWWQTGVVYQVYPRSFYDGNSDGMGDLPGISSRLDYLRWLGVDAIWLSPIYPSPMADAGYDISNYTDVSPLFGTLQDMDVLLREAHERDLKVILDFVPNHTSDEHPWFQQARSSRTNAKRDWYIWRDPAPDGGPPNNWTSHFGGSAWQLDTQSGQYYLHLFDVKQPDLNWRNPAVRQAMQDVLRFWLERGIDGFRVDVLWLLLKDEQFRDNPLKPDWQPGDEPGKYQEARYTEDQPGIHEIVREMRAFLETYEERVFIGEIYLPLKRLVEYYGEALDEAHLPFNFQLVIMPDWNAQAIRQIVDEYEALLPAGGWPNWVLGNHDNSRIATRIGREQARVAQMLLLTLRGTPTCYYGDELGMQNVQVPRERLQDPKALVNPELSRDYERTPMQWNGSIHAGFTAPDGEPWLPVAEDSQIYNVEAEQSDPTSFLTLVRRLLAYRRASLALTSGAYQPVEQENIDCFVYLREYDQERCLIVLNVTDQEQTLVLPQLNTGHVLLSTYLDREEHLELSNLHLRRNEGCLIALN